ncbi:MAG: excinuclease ABC subunit UvrC [Chloroflexi bacterium]|nr:excinuclease ABC subunit UvrC [Chloroflexota bacterium]
MSIPNGLQVKLDTTPTRPGCYLFKNERGQVIYVGKAVNLRSRVRSYFHASVENPRTVELVKRIADVEWIVVGSELEALILEMTLIKKHRPHYNVRMKDDKRYPYIKVHYADPFPRVTVTRQLNLKDGARYFGGRDPRACLYYDIKLCVGPCIGAAGRDEYRQMVDDLCSFLQGKTEPVVARLRGEMEAAAEELRFEKAAAIRDQLTAIERVVERQKVISTEKIDQDVIAFARADGDACVQVFFIRAGKLIGREYFVLEGTQDEAGAEIVTQFVKQFYDEAAYVPPQVLLPEHVNEAQVIEEWLHTKRGNKVQLKVPRRGAKRELVQMAAENAADTLATLRAQWEADTNKQTAALAELQQALSLPAPPNRIECYDISNTQGTAAAASMVVFEQGRPRKSDYRKFTIKTVQGPDDFASMREVLTRRFRRWKESKGATEQGGRGDESASEGIGAEAPRVPGQKKDESWARLPDLLIVDGGKGQLGMAVEVLKEFDLSGGVPVAGLAKQHEELFLPGEPDPVILPRRSQGLYLVQRVRDEAHRFALTQHRTQRAGLGLASQLDSIAGIGPARRKALLKRFGDLDGIRAATVEQLATVPGMSRAAAEAVKAGL